MTTGQSGSTVFDDLRVEGEELDRLVAGLDAAGWATPTPSPGWTVGHQIGHLAWVDQFALVSVTNPEGFFPKLMGDLEAAGGDVPAWLDAEAQQRADLPADELLAAWRQGRADLAAALEAAPTDAQLPWFGGPDQPQMPSQLAAARLMEWWAHGMDVAQALGGDAPLTDRLKHVADVSVDNRAYAFTAHGKDAPADDVRVELTGPAGQVWSWGPEGCGNTVTGSAEDFCRLMTQRIHRADTGLVATGAEADTWLDVGQAYAGPPGGKRAPKGG